jgi:hypothetical protein
MIENERSPVAISAICVEGNAVVVIPKNAAG